MLAKLDDNRLTLPRPALEAVGAPSHFEVTVERGRLVLTPRLAAPADPVRDKLAELGIGPDDVEQAVAWARRPG